MDKEKNDSVVRILSLYSGIGGLDLGFVNAGGFRVTRAIENDESSTKTYATNLGPGIMQRGHPRQAEFALGEADLIIGAPSCPETVNSSNIQNMLSTICPETEPLICNVSDTAASSLLTLDHVEKDLCPETKGMKNEDKIFLTRGKSEPLFSKKLKRRHCLSDMEDKESLLSFEKKPQRQMSTSNKRKRKRKSVKKTPVVQSASLVTEKYDDATDETGAALENHLRSLGCIVPAWRGHVLESVGYQQWWCPWVYSLTCEKPLQKALKNYNTDGVDDDAAYDGDTEEDEQEKTRETKVGVIETKNSVVGVGSKRKKSDSSERMTVTRRGKERLSAPPSPSLPPPLPPSLPTFDSHIEKSCLVPCVKDGDYEDSDVFDFMRIVGRVQPLAFVMVLPPKVIEHSSMEPLFNDIVRMASDYNYMVDGIVLDASDFGVPQTRRRAFLVGRSRSHHDICQSPDVVHDRWFIGPQAPKLTPIPCGDALRKLPPPGQGTNIGVCKARVVPTRNTSTGLRGSAYAGQIFNGGGRPIDLHQPCNTFSRHIGGNYTPIVDQAHIENPSVEPWYDTYYKALKTADGAIIKTMRTVPPRVRRLTVTEAKVLTGFDVSFKLCGSHSAQFKQIGGACSPSVAEHVAKYIKMIL